MNPVTEKPEARHSADARPEGSKALPRLRRHGIHHFGTLFICLVIWIWRRPEQLLRPYVWDEETTIIARYLSDGWLGAMRPLQGYLVFPSNVLVALSAQLDFSQLPRLMYVCATATFLVTVTIVVIPESRWGGDVTRACLAIGMCLVPANPEVFGVLLYGFWWASLWPFAVLGWRNSNYRMRIPVLVCGSLSSPAGGAVFILFAVRYWRERKRSDLVSAAILLCGFIVELTLTATSNRASTLRKGDTFANVVDQVCRTAGFFVARWATSPPANGFGFVTFVGAVFSVATLVAGIMLARAGRDDVLSVWVVAMIFSVISALPGPLVTDPLFVGRYYFLPFVAFTWMLLVLMREVRSCALFGNTSASIAAGRAGAVVLLTATFGLAATFGRSPADLTAKLNWATELRKCAVSAQSVVFVPVYFDGSQTFWNLQLTPKQCKDLSN